jgi:hypothetical protein
MSIPTPTPTHKLGIAMQGMIAQSKRPCFHIEGFRITVAPITGSNPGYLYIKNKSWDYVGKISPSGTMTIMQESLITDEQKLAILNAIANPETTAMSYGKRTGVCCCCGRTLTNKLSIKLGIGPICRGFWFPEVSGNLDLGMDTELDILAESLEMYPSNISDETPVHELVKQYDKLSAQQKDMFILAISDVGTHNASN